MLKTLSSLLSTVFFFAVIVFVFMIATVWDYSSKLPDYHQLEKYEPAVTTRLYAGDGQLLMEYATEKRFFVPIDKIPEKVKNAFIAAEDKKFYQHSGIDYVGIVRAILGNIKKIGTGARPGGASTITQQVAKNFLLSSELSYSRKIKEAILATRMEQAFSKDHILELYLNEIYLGNRSYGVAAAALNYFGKSLEELNVEEVAYLAALPKGPNNYHPKRKVKAAVARRNWVIGRMLEDGYITEEEALAAKEKPLVTIERHNEFVKDAEYFSEEVRRRITKNFGDDALYEGGLLVRTTVDPKLQEMATKAFRKGIKDYDARHGWRGAVANIELDSEYKNNLAKVEMPKGADDTWEKAIVLETSKEKAIIETLDGQKGVIPLKFMPKAGKTLKNQGITGDLHAVDKILNKGDVVYVEKTTPYEVKKLKVEENSYHLRQVPNVQGAMIVMDPHTGKVLAAVGGYDFSQSQFNRATQAKRQTGSSFKPFVYIAALDNGYSPTDLILDAPFVLDQGAGLPKWKPKNYTPKFYGLTTLRQGIEKSRNLMTVRLAQDLGMDKVSEYAKRFGINDNLPRYLSMSLGASDTRLIDMAAGYSMIVNGGKKVKPYFIEQVQDRRGNTILKHDQRVCETCNLEFEQAKETPKLPDNREQIVDPMTAYQMVSILEGVVIRGTGAKLRSLNKHLAGKTGTTNENKDAWFVGFSPDLVVAVYVGFDEPRTLGRVETGAAAALPIFYDFMKDALAKQPDVPFRIPNGIKLVRINHNTGKPATPMDKSVIIEALKPDFEFDKKTQKVIGSDEPSEEEKASNSDYVEDGDNEFQLGEEY